MPSTPKETRVSRLLIHDHPLMVSPALACAVGLNLAMLLQQTHFWIETNGKPRKGRKWTYMTLDDWGRQFPFWSPSTIRRTIAEGEERGLLISNPGDFNKSKADRTKWYTIDYAALARLEVAGAGETPSVQNEQASAQFEQASGQDEQATVQNEQPSVQNEQLRPKTSDETSVETSVETSQNECVCEGALSADPAEAHTHDLKVEEQERQAPDGAGAGAPGAANATPATVQSSAIEAGVNGQDHQQQEIPGGPAAAGEARARLAEVFGARMLDELLADRNVPANVPRARWLDVGAAKVVELREAARHDPGVLAGRVALQTVVRRALDDLVRMPVPDAVATGSPAPATATVLKTPSPADEARARRLALLRGAQ